MSAPDSLISTTPLPLALSLAVMPVCDDASLKALMLSARPAAVARARSATLKVTLAAVLLSPLDGQGVGAAGGEVAQLDLVARVALTPWPPSMH